MNECEVEQLEWELKVTLAARQLKRADMVSLLLRGVEQLEAEDKQLSGRLFLVLSELVNNALDHGLLKLDSALKQSPQGMDHYFEERAARLGRLEQGEIHVRLRKLADNMRRCIRVDVRDSGEGFEYTRMLSRIDSDINHDHHGRGIALVKCMSSAMSYSGNGSKVCVCFTIDGTQCCKFGEHPTEAG